MDKLPKQFQRWAKKAGLKPSYSSSLARRYECTYFTGFGRNWRINCHGELDMSKPFANFDKWAGGREESMPMNSKNEAEFVKLVKEMVWLGALNKQLKKGDDE